MPICKVFNTYNWNNQVHVAQSYTPSEHFENALPEIAVTDPGRLISSSNEYPSNTPTLRSDSVDPLPNTTLFASAKPSKTLSSNERIPSGSVNKER